MLRPFHAAAVAAALATLPVAAARAGGGGAGGGASGIEVALTPAAANPASPRMGDRIGFASEVRNADPVVRDGLVAWISLVRMDKGREAPVDLEDWSAQKAVALPPLAPGQSVRPEWPMRLIAAGRYRAVVSVAAPTGAGLATSPFVDLAIAEKPVVESGRVLPVATFVPALVLGLLAWRRWGAGRVERS